MKYTVIYARKVRVKAYESMEIGLHMEFDTTTNATDAFRMVRDTVEGWISEQSDRVLAAHGKRPEVPREE